MYNETRGLVNNTVIGNKNMSHAIKSWIGKILLYLILLSIAVATVTSTGCFGLIDQIFPGWRDKTGCETISTCFGDTNSIDFSIEAMGMSLLFFSCVAATYYILLMVKNKFYD